MPELREIGLDPAVQGVPVKKKPSVRHLSRSSSDFTFQEVVDVGATKCIIQGH